MIIEPVIATAKYPLEVIIYVVNWNGVIPSGVNITESSSDVLDGTVSIDDDTFEDAIQNIRVSGGTRGAQRIRAQITLSDGQILAQDIAFQVIP